MFKEEVMKKKTKIVATISNLKCDKEYIKALVDAGMNVVRINTAHASEEGALEIIRTVREISDEVAILIDTKGPEIRTVKTEKVFQVEEGQDIRISGANLLNEADCLYTSYPWIVKDVPVGSALLIDDGDVMLSVVEKDADYLYCKVENSGVIKGMKSINIPNVSINLPSLTDKDRRFIHFAIENDLAFIAHSFVRSKEDVQEIREILDANESDIKIIAKIENQEGVDNIDEILDNVYGIMVARGDLAIEIPAERIPVIQEQLVRKCVQSKKPVIIATQMLHSMIENPRPTRAEVTDVAHAVFSHADAIMLSGETAYGNYGLEAVETMNKIACETEKDMEPKSPEMNLVRVNNEVTAMLAKSAVNSSMQLPVKAFVLDTLSGRTARYISAFRGKYPVYAICYNRTIMRQLALSYGVEAVYMPPHASRRMFMAAAFDLFLSQKFFTKDDLVIVIGGSFGPGNGATFMEISKVEDLRLKD